MLMLRAIVASLIINNLFICLTFVTLFCPKKEPTLIALGLLVLLQAILFTEAHDSVIKSAFKEFGRPVVLVPGIYSSKLTASIKDADSELCQCFGVQNLTLWMNTTLFTDHKIFNCFIELLKTTPESEQIANYELPGYGDISTIGNLGEGDDAATAYMSPLLEALEIYGHDKIRAAVFDFRYSPDYLAEKEGLFTRLTSLIKRSYRRHYKQKVVLVCHSMGCLLSLLYLQQQSQSFKDQYIERLISLAGAFGGSVNSLVGLTYGYDFHLGLPLGMLHGFRAAFRTQQSSYFMLPNEDIFPDEPVANVGAELFAPSKLGDYFTAINYSEGTQLYEQFRNRHDVRLGPGVDVHCLYGTDIPTIDRVNVSHLNTLEQDVGISPYSFGNGDGVVNEASLSVCQLWKDNNAGHSVQHTSYSGANHMDILSNREMHKYLLEVALLD